MVVSLHYPLPLIPLDIGNRDYYAALLKTQQAFVTPTQGKLLNYVQRVPLGVVAQVTVGMTASLSFGPSDRPRHLAFQPPALDCVEENRPSTCGWQFRDSKTF